MKIGVYLELERRGRSIPGGGKLSSELEANAAAVPPHKLINQQRQINSDKHAGHFWPFGSETAGRGRRDGDGGGQFGEQSMNSTRRKYLKKQIRGLCVLMLGGCAGRDWTPAVSQEQPNGALLGTLLRNIDSANLRPHLSVSPPFPPLRSSAQPSPPGLAIYLGQILPVQTRHLNSISVPASRQAHSSQYQFSPLK